MPAIHRKSILFQSADTREKERYEKDANERATVPDLVDYSTRGVYGMFGFGSKENHLSIKNLKYHKNKFGRELDDLPDVDSDRLFQERMNAESEAK